MRILRGKHTEVFCAHCRQWHNIQQVKSTRVHKTTLYVCPETGLVILRTVHSKQVRSVLRNAGSRP